MAKKRKVTRGYRVPITAAGVRFSVPGKTKKEAKRNATNFVKKHLKNVRNARRDYGGFVLWGSKSGYFGSPFYETKSMATHAARRFAQSRGEKIQVRKGRRN